MREFKILKVVNLEFYCREYPPVLDNYYSVVTFNECVGNPKIMLFIPVFYP